MPHLTKEAQAENAMALAAAAGIPVEQAATRLNVAVLVSYNSMDATAVAFVEDLAPMLLRTVNDVRATPDSPDIEGITVELVIGDVAPRAAAACVFVSLDTHSVTIDHVHHPTGKVAEVPRLFLLMAACYTCAAVMDSAIGDVLPYAFPAPFVLRFDSLGVDPAALERPVNLGQAYLAGAGAIGNAVLWAARYVDLRGELVIADDDVVSSGNLNRQIWFNSDDVGQPKATTLAANAQPYLRRLKLVPEKHRLQDLPQKNDGPWLARLLSTVDSRRARRELQSEFPGEVFDASTTDIREVVSFHMRQPSTAACLSCVYAADTEEYTREHHIAEHLGVEVGEVRADRISENAARTIATQFGNLKAGDLVGMSFDTLFKQLCGEAALTNPSGRRILAPFAFVSCLAGVLLVLDLVRRLGDEGRAVDFNYWRVSAWHPPIAKRRTMRPAEPACSFCGRSALARVNEELWGPRY